MKRQDTFAVLGKSGWDINSDSEAISVEDNFLSSISFSVGDNVRVHNKDRDSYAMKTIQRTHTEDGGEDWIRMGYDARATFYDSNETVPDTFDAAMLSRAQPLGIQTESEADSNGELVNEWYREPNANIAVIAQHGGLVESGSDEIGKFVAKYLDCSYWTAIGYDGPSGAFDKWHITSTDIDVDSWSGLYWINKQAPFDLVLSIQGFSGSENVIGGRADLELRENIASRIDAVYDNTDAVVVGKNTDSSPHGSIDGDSDDNIVNRLSKNLDNGVQIEFTYDSRHTSREEVAREIARAVYYYRE